MTIDDSTRRINSLGMDDLSVASEAVAARGRSVVEFASAADPQTLLAAHAAGQQLIDRLLDERRRLLVEMRNARTLHDSLNSNVSEVSRPMSLLGPTLLA